MKRQLKILYVDAHLHFINPTNTLTPTLLYGVGDVTFYGPGYVSAEELSGGILRYLDKTGPFDCLVLGPNVPAASNRTEDLKESAEFVRDYTALGSPVKEVYSFYRDVLENLVAVPVACKIAFLINFDSYSANQSHVDCLEERRLSVVTPNAHFVSKVTDLPDWADQEKHFRRNRRHISDAWYDFLSRRPERIINALHFMSDSEFSFRGLAERKNEISIPGIDYVPRKVADRLARHDGVRVSRKTTYRLYRVANKLGLPVFRRYSSLKYFNITFLGNLISTRYAYTAAEAFGMPIRKYFEIPAAGAVLLASPCNGFGRIGFKDGVNCIRAAPDELPDAVRDLQGDPGKAQRIASAGRKLVFEQHSLRARAEQVKACISAMVANQYAESEWIGGEFHMRASLTNDERAGGRGPVAYDGTRVN